jgi:hypothetical protein
MPDQIVTFRDLQQLCRPGQDAPRPSRATVERWARRQGIRYLYDGQGGIFTTLLAINAAMGLETAPPRTLTPADVFGPDSW